MGKIGRLWMKPLLMDFASTKLYGRHQRNIKIYSDKGRIYLAPSLKFQLTTGKDWYDSYFSCGM